MKNLEELDVQEMDIREMKKENGGFLILYNIAVLTILGASLYGAFRAGYDAA